MGKTTGIAWTSVPGYVGGTWNPWQGCTKVSAGCTNCYMFREKRQYGQDPAVVVHSAAPTFYLPEKIKEPHAWFVCSWSDFFHEDADRYRTEANIIMEENPQHLYLILTKRIERAWKNMSISWRCKWPENVWLGVSIENQAMADKRIPPLLDIPARVHFVSVEPMLERMDILNPTIEQIDWVICGGESGPGARPMNLEWARFLRKQCQWTHTPFFFKQVGGTQRDLNGQWGGDLLDDEKCQEFPV